MLKKGTKKPQEGASTKESERGLTLLKLSLPPIVVVVLVVLVCGYTAYLQYASLVKQAKQVQHVADAEKMAALMGGRLVALGDQVAAQAKAGDALMAVIKAHDKGALRLYEQGLKSYFPSAVRIRIVTPADTDPDLSVRPPIGYACLDLARQAEAGTERPPLEMHLVGSEFAHLDLVRPIVKEGKVVASLMVSFEPGAVKGWLKRLILDGGFVELQQGWDGPILGNNGDLSLKQGKPTHRAVIPGSSWQLSYWAPDGIGMAEAQKVGFLATFAIAALVIAIFMYFYARFISRTVTRELGGMVEFMIESSFGKRYHSYPVKMLEMEQALQQMEPVLKRVKSDDGIKEKAESGDGGVPDMMFMDFGEITVEEEGGNDATEGDATKS